MPARAPKLPTTGLLTHFTRASRSGDALDNLVAILSQQMIAGSARMILTKQPAVCLFDAPITELKHLLSRDNRHRYQPFGIAVDKRYAFAQGARPVIYMPLREARQMLPEAELWRVMALDLGRTPPVDWTFEREWRVRDRLALPERGAVALVETWRDVDEIYDRFDGTPPCAGVVPLEDLFGLNA